MTAELCVLMVNGPPGTCQLCGVALTGRRRTWCSDAHGDWYWRNHSWTGARFEARRRATVQDADGWWLWFICDECGRHTTAPEVNHVEPRNGGPYDGGCWNHQTNLQMLCHGCHVAETNRQRGHRPPRARPSPATPEPLRQDAA